MKVHVIYYELKRNSTPRVEKTITWDKYLDLIMSADVIVKNVDYIID